MFQRAMNQDLPAADRMNSLRLVTHVGGETPEVQAQIAALLEDHAVADEAGGAHGGVHNVRRGILDGDSLEPAFGRLAARRVLDDGRYFKRTQVNHLYNSSSVYVRVA